MAFTFIPHEVDVDGDTPLLWVLRDVLGIALVINNCNCGGARHRDWPLCGRC